jgi:hypothetical protein
MSDFKQTTLSDLGSGTGAGPWPVNSAAASQLCIPNINTRERRARLAAGAVELVIGLAILAALMAFGVDRWWRLPLILVFSGAASGFFQWRDRT